MEREPIAKREMTEFVFGVRVRQCKQLRQLIPALLRS